MCINNYVIQGPSFQSLAISTRALLTYNMTENERTVLSDLNINLKKLHKKTYDQLPNKDGIPIRPRDQRQVINIRRRVWKAKVLKCSSLPHLRCRKRAPSSFRNRFGIKADRHRNQVNQPHVFSSHVIYKLPPCTLEALHA